MSSKQVCSSDIETNQQRQDFHVPQEFQDHLEDLVYEILKEKPSDLLDYAFHFFSKRLKTREESKIAESGTDEMKTTTTSTSKLIPKQKRFSEDKSQDYREVAIETQSKAQARKITETQAATIIQAYFRGYNVRQNRWRRRYLKISLNYNDHLSVRRDLISPRGSFSLCWPEAENILAIAANYDSEESVDLDS